MKKIKLLLIYLTILFTLSIPAYAEKYTINYYANGGKQAPVTFVKTTSKLYSSFVNGLIT